MFGAVFSGRRPVGLLAGLLATLLFSALPGFAADGTLFYFGRGGQQTVSGSLHALETPAGIYLIDAGAFVGADGDNYPWPEELPVERIRALFITHVHADHIGRLPLLLHLGYRGPIYLSRISYEIARLSLAADLHLADLGPERFYYSRRNQGRERIPVYLESYDGPRPVRPENRLFFESSRPGLAARGYYLAAPQQQQLAADLHRRLAEQAVIVDPGQSVTVDDFTVRFLLTPHMPGSAMIKMGYRDDFTVLFSGDVGADGSPLLPDNPRLPRPVDVLFVEGTSSSQRPSDISAGREAFRQQLADWIKAGRRVVIPAFALDRSQQVMFEIGRAIADGRLPADQVVRVCSPAANELLILYAEMAADRDRFAGYFRPDVRQAAFLPPGYTDQCRGDDPANRLGLAPGEIGIMTSGMAEYAAARQALLDYLEDPQTVFCFVSYQAPATPGGRLTAGATELDLDGQRRRVRAVIARTGAFGGHATLAEMARLFAAADPARLFLVHLDNRRAPALLGHWQQLFPAAELTVPAPGRRYQLYPPAGR